MAKSTKSAKSTTSAKVAPVTILEKQDAEVLLSSIVRRGKALEVDIQKLLITAIGYANLHGDVTVAQRVFTGLSVLKGSRMQAVVAFCEKHGCLKFDAKGSDKKAATKNFVHHKNEKAIKEPVALIESLMLPDNFWTLAIPEKIESTVDALEKITALVDGLSKKSKKEEVAHAQVLQFINKAVAEYRQAVERGEIVEQHDTAAE